MASPTSNDVITSTVSLSGYNYIDSLLSTYKWGGGGKGTGVALPDSFPSGTAWWVVGYGVGDNEPESWGSLDTTQQTAAISALGKWANVANVTFSQTSDGEFKVGEIRFAWWTDPSDSEQAHASISPATTRKPAMSGCIVVPTGATAGAPAAILT